MQSTSSNQLRFAISISIIEPPLLTFNYFNLTTLIAFPYLNINKIVTANLKIFFPCPGIGE